MKTSTCESSEIVRIETSGVARYTRDCMKNLRRLVTSALAWPDLLHRLSWQDSFSSAELRCPICEQAVCLLVAPLGGRCFTLSLAFAGARDAAYYENAVPTIRPPRVAIRRFKYGPHMSAEKPQTPPRATYFPLVMFAYDLILPIPFHIHHPLRAGSNQSLGLAQSIRRSYQINVVCCFLIRTRLMLPRHSSLKANGGPMRMGRFVLSLKTSITSR